MNERDSIINNFLSSSRWDNSKRINVAGDASFRRYDRVIKDDGVAILMDAPPPQEDVTPFIKIDEFLISNGFSAPKIISSDIENGLLLLEDLGDNRYTRILSGESNLKNKPTEEELYKLAINTLIEIQKTHPPNIPEYNENLLFKELFLFTEWYIPLIYRKEKADEIRGEYEDIWKDLMPNIVNREKVVVCRDYHADNLMWLPEREGVKKVGLLDFQDAVVGHPAYDLVSLLVDARRVVDKNFAEEMLEYYISKSTYKSEDFVESYSILGAQRNLKIVGIFTRLAIRDGKKHYLSLIPRVWGYIERDISIPSMARLKEWLDKIIPRYERDKPL